ncbi:MAG: hypothetical protein K2K12_06040 [Clostridia bacterium]|nr:hypothetical protein [Clostridia bacterium]
MIWNKTKTDWGDYSVPTAGDFNRIEGNIKELISYDDYLETILGRKNAVIPLPIENGGTNATDKKTARKNLGIEEFSENLSCCMTTEATKEATACTYDESSEKKIKFQGIRIGNTIICSGCIDFDGKVDADKWVRIKTGYTVVSVVAAIKKISTKDSATDCICYFDGKYAFVASEQKSSKGLYVTLTLKAD